MNKRDANGANGAASRRAVLDRRRFRREDRGIVVASHAELLVRPADAADLRRIAPIWRDMMDLHATTDACFALSADAERGWLATTEHLLTRSDAFIFIADDAGAAVGFCVGWIATNPPIYHVPQVGFISEIAVAPHARRRGIGTELIEAARRWFTDRALGEFQLSTAVWNHTALRFWEKLGGAALLTRYRFELAPPAHSQVDLRRRTR